MLPGGQMATAMVACARLGWRARYVGAVGDDETGVRVAATLAAEGVEASPGAAAGHGEPDGRHSRRSQHGPTDRLVRRDPALALEAGDVPAEIFSAGRLLMLDATELPAAVRAARVAQAAGIPTMIDVDQLESDADAPPLGD